MKEIAIRPWRAHDAEPLRPMIAAYLQEFHAQGGHILPSPANAEQMWIDGLFSAFRGEPTLVAVDASEKILGYVQTSDVNRATPYALDQRILAVLGMYTLPDERSGMIYVRLLRAVGKAMQELGYTWGTSQNLMQNHHLLQVVFLGDTWPIGVMLEWQVAPPALDSGVGKAGVGR